MTDSVTRLSLKQCSPLVEALKKGVEGDGILVALKDFDGSQSELVRQAAHSWYQGLKAGKSFQDSLLEMNPRFLPGVEALILMGIESSILDYVLSDIYEIQTAGSATVDPMDPIGLLVDKYQNNPGSEMICEGCFQRELSKILQRAQLENAYEVILMQEEESFFHQKYLAVKLIHIIEASHSKTYRTILTRL